MSFIFRIVIFYLPSQAVKYVSCHGRNNIFEFHARPRESTHCGAETTTKKQIDKIYLKFPFAFIFRCVNLLYFMITNDLQTLTYLIYIKSKGNLQQANPFLFIILNETQQKTTKTIASLEQGACVSIILKLITASVSTIFLTSC